MKKYFLQAILLFTSIAAFAQDDQHDATYNWSEKNALWIIIGVIVVIVLIVIVVRRSKKKTP